MGQRTAQHVGDGVRKGQGTFRLKFSQQSAKNELVFDPPRSGTIDLDWAGSGVQTDSVDRTARGTKSVVLFRPRLHFDVGLSSGVRIEHWDLVGSPE